MLVLEELTLPMPELPDIVVYLEALQTRVVGERLERLRIASPFLLRSVEPRPEELAGRVVRRLARLGKRIVFGFDDDYFVILHLMIAARLSPLKLTSQLTAEEVERLHHATRDTLRAWIERLRKATGDAFPEGVTAFREEMAVHGRYRKPCPVCGSPVQRIRYAKNDVNYCATCQTGGRVLADRALSRLLQEDWPRSLEEWEARLPGTPGAHAG